MAYKAICFYLYNVFNILHSDQLTVRHNDQWILTKLNLEKSRKGYELC